MADLVQALSFSSLVGGTLQYAMLMRHRQERREEERQLHEVAVAGRQALWRARLLDRGTPGRSWTTAGTRFR